MRDILVADFMPGGYTQVITAGLEEIVTKARTELNSRPHSQLETFVQEAGLRALCLVAAVFTTAANVVMGLPYLVATLYKCVENRYNSPHLFAVIGITSLIATAILLGGTVVPLLGTVVSPDTYGENSTFRISGPLVLINTANIALFILTLPELDTLLGNALGVNLSAYRDRITIADWRKDSIDNSARRYGEMTFDQASRARDECNTDLLRLAGVARDNFLNQILRS